MILQEWNRLHDWQRLIWQRPSFVLDYPQNDHHDFFAKQPTPGEGELKGEINFAIIVVHL